MPSRKLLAAALAPNPDIRAKLSQAAQPMREGMDPTALMIALGFMQPTGQSAAPNMMGGVNPEAQMAKPSSFTNDVVNIGSRPIRPIPKGFDSFDDWLFWNMVQNKAEPLTREKLALMATHNPKDWGPFTKFAGALPKH